MLLLRLVLVFCWTRLGAADGNVQIYFDSYFDGNVKQSNGDCCRPAVGVCLESCGNYFEVCYRPVNTTELFLTCQTTGVLLTAPDPVFTSLSSITFTLNQTLGNGVRNPISLFFRGSWPGGLNLEVNVSNYYTSPPAFIASFVYEDSSTSYGDFSSLISLSDLSKEKSLDIKWRVRCSDHFYNEDCSIFCEPVDDVSGHYDCLSNGTKRCLPGWTNPQNDCTTAEALCASEPCQNNGSCIIEFGEIKCNCIIGYKGDYCETNIDECLSSPCQNNGTCHDDVNSYSCLCKVGYKGINCETSHLPTPFISTKIGCNSSSIQPTSRITYDTTADIIGYSVQLTSIHGQINLEFLLNNNTDHVFLEELQQDTLYTFQIRARSINGLGIASSSHMLRCENKEKNVRSPITATVATATLVISISVILLVLAACYFYRGRRLTSTVDTVTKMNTTELDKQEQMNEDVMYETVVDTDFSTEVITRSQLYEETPMVLTRSQLYMYAEPSAEVVDNQPYS